MLSNTQETQELRKNFHQYYYNNILGELASFEQYRQSELFKYMAWMACLVIAALVGIGSFIYFMQTMPPDLFWGTGHRDGMFQAIIIIFVLIISGFYVLADKVKKKFEIKVKRGVINSFLKFFGDFRWSSKESVTEDEILDSKLVEIITKLDSDDYFEGTYKDLKIVISENKITQGTGKNSTTTFEGLFIKLKMRKQVDSHTIVAQDGSFEKFMTNFYLPSKFEGLEKTELEDPEFNKMFDVHTDDEVGARYILTVSFMERLKRLKEVYNAKDIRASFKGNTLLIALYCKKDMFVLGDVRKPVTDSGEIQTLFEEFAAVLSIVDVLNLTSKTGL